MRVPKRDVRALESRYEINNSVRERVVGCELEDAEDAEDDMWPNEAQHDALDVYA